MNIDQLFRYLRFVNWQLAALKEVDPTSLRTTGSWSEKTQNSAFAGSCTNHLSCVHSHTAAWLFEFLYFQFSNMEFFIGTA